MNRDVKAWAAVVGGWLTIGGAAALREIHQQKLASYRRQATLAIEDLARWMQSDFDPNSRYAHTERLLQELEMKLRRSDDPEHAQELEAFLQLKPGLLRIIAGEDPAEVARSGALGPTTL